MTMTSTARNPMRDSSEDVVTRVYPRPPPFSLDRAMVQRIMGELRPTLDTLAAPPGAAARPIVTRRLPSQPNVFLTPWTAAQPRFNALNDLRDMITGLAAALK